MFTALAISIGIIAVLSRSAAMAWLGAIAVIALLGLASISQAAPASLGDTLWNMGVFGPEITINTTCGTLGMSSMGGCRQGLIGLADQQAHGTCWIDRRSGRPTCER